MIYFSCKIGAVFRSKGMSANLIGLREDISFKIATYFCELYFI